MRNKKLFLVTIIILLISAMALTACGKSDGGKNNTTPPDQAKVDSVVALIDNIPSNLSGLSLISDEILVAKTAYEDAYAAYTALNAAEKALVPLEKESKLGAAKTWYEGVAWNTRNLKIVQAKLAELNTKTESNWGATEATLIASIKELYTALSATDKAALTSTEKALYETATAWLASGTGVNAQITALPAVGSVTLANQSAVALIKIDYDNLSTYQKTLVESTNVTKLTNVIAKIKELITQAQIFDVYVEDGAGAYTKHSSYVSVLEAAKAALKEGLPIYATEAAAKTALDNDSAVEGEDYVLNTTPFVGAYVLERNSGNLVYRKTNSGAASIGNNNTFYVYRDNMFIETAGYYEGIYEAINALEDDTILFNSASGIMAAGKYYTTAGRNYIKNANYTEARQQYSQYQESFGAITISTDNVVKSSHILRLAAMEINEPQIGEMKFEFYYGATSYNHKTLIGVYFDFASGEWKFYSAEGGGHPGSGTPAKAYDTMTYKYEETDIQVLTTASKDEFGVWRTKDDLKLTYGVDLVQGTGNYPAKSNLKVENLTTGEIFDYQITVNEPNGIAVGGQFFSYGANFANDRKEGVDDLTDIWSGGYIKNFGIEGGNFTNKDDNSFDFLIGEQSHQVWTSRRVVITKDSATKQTINVNLNKPGVENKKAPTIPANDTNVQALESNGERLSLIGTSNLTKDVYVWDIEATDLTDRGLVTYFTGWGTVKALIGSSNISVVTVSEADDGVFKINAVAAGTATVKIYVVQNGIMIQEVEFDVIVANDPGDLDTAIAALGAGDPTAVTIGDHDLIYSLINAYNAMSAEDQLLVLNYNDLETAKETVDQLKADVVIALIDEFDGTLTIAKIADVEAAREAYDALNDDQQALVTNYADLETAEEKIADADEVEVLINALPTEITLTNEAKVLEAYNAFNGLSAELQGLISDVTQTKLTNAYDALMAAIVAKAEKAIDDIDAKYDTAVSFEDIADIIDDIIAARKGYETLDPTLQAEFNATKLTRLSALETKMITAMDTKILAMHDVIDTLGLSAENDIMALYWYTNAIPTSLYNELDNVSELDELFDRMLLLKLDPIYDVYLWNPDNSANEYAASVQSILEAVAMIWATPPATFVNAAGTTVTAAAGAAGFDVNQMLSGQYIVERNSNIVVFRYSNGGKVETGTNNAIYYFKNNRLFDAGVQYGAHSTTIGGEDNDDFYFHSANGFWQKGKSLNKVIHDREVTGDIGRVTNFNMGDVQASIGIKAADGFSEFKQTWNLSEAKIMPAKNTIGSKSHFQIYFEAGFWGQSYEIGIYMDNNGDFKFFNGYANHGAVGYKAFTYDYSDARVIMGSNRLPNGEYVPEANLSMHYTVLGAERTLKLVVTNLLTEEEFTATYDMKTSKADVGDPITAAYAEWGWGFSSNLPSGMPLLWTGSYVENLKLVSSKGLKADNVWYDTHYYYEQTAGPSNGAQVHHSVRGNRVSVTNIGLVGNIFNVLPENRYVSNLVTNPSVPFSLGGSATDPKGDGNLVRSENISINLTETKKIDLATYVTGFSGVRFAVAAADQTGKITFVFDVTTKAQKYTLTGTQAGTALVTVSLYQQIWNDTNDEWELKIHYLYLNVSVVDPAADPANPDSFTVKDDHDDTGYVLTGEEWTLDLDLAVDTESVTDIDLNTYVNFGTSFSTAIIGATLAEGDDATVSQTAGVVKLTAGTTEETATLTVTIKQQRLNVGTGIYYTVTHTITFNVTTSIAA